MSNKSYIWFGIIALGICVGWIVVCWLVYDLSLIVRILFTLLWVGIAIFVFVYIIYPILREMKSEKIDKFNYLERKINHLERQIDYMENLESKINKMEDCCFELSEKLDKYIKVVKCRDYLIRTKFVGSLTNKKLIKQWKENMDGTDFKESVIDFDIHEDKYDYFLEDLKVLRELEEKQNILNLYTEKPKKATSASNGSKNIAKDLKREKKDNE